MTGHRTRLSIYLALLVMVALALPGGLSAATQGPAPSATAGRTIFLPLVGLNFPSPSVAPVVRFWALRYTMDEGNCTVLQWRTTGAKGVWLDGQPVTAAGTIEACPTGAQFYTLEVQNNTGEALPYELDLLAGDKDLLPTEVIAHARVQSVTPTTDVDPSAPGDQPGYTLQLANIVKLYAQDASWNQTTVTLRVPQSLIDFGFNFQVHWPVTPPQQVEFRANCDAATCSVVETAPSYLYLRSE